MEMESLLPNNKPTNGGNGIKRYLRRRRYQNLNHGGATTSGKKVKMIRLRKSPHRYWRIRTIPRLRWVITSPFKMLTNLKNVYINFMLRYMNIDNIFGGKRIPKAPKVSEDYSRDVFEARLIYEISKALVASHQLHPIM